MLETGENRILLGPKMRRQEREKKQERRIEKARLMLLVRSLQAGQHAYEHQHNVHQINVFNIILCPT
jgi:hypothetical protein